MGDLIPKLMTWYFSNKAAIDAAKGNQYIAAMQTELKDPVFVSKLKDLLKVASAAWREPEIVKVVDSLKAEFGWNKEDAPIITFETKGDPNPLHAKGDVR